MSFPLPDLDAAIEALEQQGYVVLPPDRDIVDLLRTTEGRWYDSVKESRVPEQSLSRGEVAIARARAKKFKVMLAQSNMALKFPSEWVDELSDAQLGVVRTELYKLGVVQRYDAFWEIT